MRQFDELFKYYRVFRCAVHRCDSEGIADAIISGSKKLKLKKVSDKIDGCDLVANTYYNLGKDLMYRDSLSFIGTFASRIVGYMSNAYKGSFEADFKKVLADVIWDDMNNKLFLTDEDAIKVYLRKYFDINNTAKYTNWFISSNLDSMISDIGGRLVMHPSGTSWVFL